MIRSGLGGVEFLAANTDAQALEHKLAPTPAAARHRGDPRPRLRREPGEAAGRPPSRTATSLRDMLIGSDMVFVTAGLGGGTGTGAAPVIAEVAREVGALTVAVVTKPFPFEGRQRSRHAEQGLDELHRVVDTLITIPNQRLLALAGKDTADHGVLQARRRGAAERGQGHLGPDHRARPDQPRLRRRAHDHERDGHGADGYRRSALGESRAKDAAYAAISSPLLEDASASTAPGAC